MSRAADWGPDIRERVARKKLGDPADFKFYGYEVIGDARDILMTGCVTTKLITRGERKGQPAYEGKPQRVVVTRGEIAAAAEAYEASTGKCSECLGDGLAFAAWSHITGTTWRKCQKCSGSGLRVQP